MFLPESNRRASPVASVNREETTMAHPVIDADECIACGVCVDSCPAGVLELQDVATVADEDSCVACGACQDACPLARSPRSSRSNNSPTCTLKSTPCTKKEASASPRRPPFAICGQLIWSGTLGSCGGIVPVLCLGCRFGTISPQLIDAASTRTNRLRRASGLLGSLFP